MKLSYKLIAAAIVCFSAISCTPKEPDIEPEDPVVFQNANAKYYDDTENSEAYFTMDLADGNKKLHLEFYGDPVGDYDSPMLKTGDYSLAAGSATEPGTFIAGSSEGGCVYSEPNGAGIDLCNIIGGVFSISLSGTTYNVTIELRDQDGKDFQGSYNGPITVEDTREIVLNDFVWGFNSFYGKDITDDTHLFWVGLNSDGIAWDPASKAYVGDGYYLRLRVMTGADALTEIPDGTYTVAESATPGNIMIDSNDTYYAEVVSDVTAIKFITAGAVTFQRSGDIYTVVMDITDADGNNYKKFYQGELDYSNYSNGLIEDLDMGEFASGLMSYYGKTDAENAHNFSVVLLGNGVEIDSGGTLTGNGYVMTLDTYTAMTLKTDIEPATYLVAATGAPGTVFESYVWILDRGSYIYWVEDGITMKTTHIKGGTVTVSGANPSYNFQIAFKGPNGFNIGGSYSGSLEYFDESPDNISLPGSDPSDRYRFVAMSVGNWGNYYGAGTTNLAFSFKTDEFSMYIDAVTPDIGDSTVAPAGTYTFADTKLAYTFNKNSNVYSEDFNFYIEGGTMTITDLDGGDRTYSFDLDMGEKGMFYAEYELPAPGDIDLTEFEGGRVMYYGGLFSNGTSSRFHINVYSPGIYMADGYYRGTGYVLALDLYADPSAMTKIPAGVYNVTDSFAPGNIRISSTETQYFEIITGITSATRALKSGSATVSRSGDVYTLDMAFVDEYGKDITGLFIGELEYSNQTAVSTSRNYVEKTSANGPARKPIASKSGKAKPVVKKAGHANNLLGGAVKTNASEYRRPTGSIHMAQ